MKILLLILIPLILPSCYPYFPYTVKEKHFGSLVRPVGPGPELSLKKAPWEPHKTKP